MKDLSNQFGAVDRVSYVFLMDAATRNGSAGPMKVIAKGGTEIEKLSKQLEQQHANHATEIEKLRREKRAKLKELEQQCAKHAAEINVFCCKEQAKLVKWISTLSKKGGSGVVLQL